ncbi:MAG: hypothetical protein ACRD8O_19650 [Bryobacteraceae bacterium]
MDEIQEAHHELDRLQGIITRHEGHMFSLRGWLLTIVGGILAAYYTDKIAISEWVLRIALPGVTFLFFVVELRHGNLVEVLVERVRAIENDIAKARLPAGQICSGWYAGPKVSESCEAGAKRWWPRSGMTIRLNAAFYLVVFLVIVLVTFSLPPRGRG